jgi:hypothetical protein
MNQDDTHEICNEAWQQMSPMQAHRAVLLGLAAMVRAFTDGVLRIAEDLPPDEACRARLQFLVYASLVRACTEGAPFSDRETALMTAWRRPDIGGTSRNLVH